jgi:hypothetical protein
MNRVFGRADVVPPRLGEESAGERQMPERTRQLRREVTVGEA